MSNTVLGFWDFFWIWFVVLIAGGGSTYLSSRDTAKLDALQKQIGTLTELLRAKEAAAAPAAYSPPAGPVPSWLDQGEQKR
jgi:hypothetical protein